MIQISAKHLVFGVERERAETSDGALVVLLVIEGEAPVVVDIGIFGLERERLLKIRDLIAPSWLCTGLGPYREFPRANRGN